MPFTCTICEEESTRICIACTKDTCGNHLCEKCRRCSDCCDCELHLDVSEHVPAEPIHYFADDLEEDDLEDDDEFEEFDEAEPVEVVDLAEGPREPQPHPHPLPDPDPAPEPDPMPIPGFPGPEENN